MSARPRFAFRDADVTQIGRLMPDNIGKFAGAPLEGRMRDLLDLMVKCYCDDRRARRVAAAGDEPMWDRVMDVEIAVRDLAFWQRDDVRIAAQNFLGHLTADRWVLSYVAGAPTLSGAAPDQSTLSYGLPTETRFALFSGGADSLAGAALDLQQLAGRSAPLVLVSASTNNRMLGRQRELAAKLRKTSGREVNWVHVPLGMRQDSTRREERSQRTRAAVFLTLGAVCAAACGSNHLKVYENGIGSLNLPYLAFQHGTHNTRATHPATLRFAEELFALVFDRPFRLVQPYLFWTKAEMFANLEPRYYGLLQRAVSCDTGFSSRRAAPCGTCTSCLLRRQSHHGSKLQHLDPAGRYAFDAFAAPKPPAGDQLHAMLDQARRLQIVLRHERPGEALMKQYPTFANAVRNVAGVGPDEAMGRFVSMYRSYVNEWQHVPTELVGQYLRFEAAVPAPRNLVAAGRVA